MFILKVFYYVRFPGEFELLSGLDRMVVVRCLRPDKVVPSVQQYIVDHMGQPFIEPPTFDLQGSYDDSTSIVPLIFILSPGADPTAGIFNLIVLKFRICLWCLFSGFFIGK